MFGNITYNINVNNINWVPVFKLTLLLIDSTEGQTMADQPSDAVPSQASKAEDIVARGERPAGDGQTTTLGGTPVASENVSISVGRQGPNVLDDIHMIEKLAHFNRENVPERIPHAKGHGAFGELHITEDVSQYTKAKLFQPGTVLSLIHI